MFSPTVRSGLFHAVVAYGLWGVLPLYFRALNRVSPGEILAHRIVWSVGVLALLLAITRRWRALGDAVRSSSTRRLLILSSAFIGANWFLFLTAVTTGQVMQASLGYFINPLLYVVLGQVVFREPLRTGQWLAVALACCGLIVLVTQVGKVPILALLLAFTFASYGLCRKVAPVDGVVGLSVEVALLAPLALGYMLYRHFDGSLALGQMDWSTDMLLLLSGVATAVPLMCFGQAARLLPLSLLGFMQYISPSLQFLVALSLGEPCTPWHVAGFGLIWVALILFSVEAWLARRPRAESVCR